MDSLNQTCFFSLLFLLRYQFFMGMLDWLGEMQVSPVSMLQWTLMASRADPWLGSTQYMPVTEKHETELVRILYFIYGLQQDSELHSPLFHSGWHILRSRHMRAGLFWVPSGLRIFSTFWVRVLRVVSTSMSRSRIMLGSSARYPPPR